MIALPDRFVRGVLDGDDMEALKCVYTALYPGLDLATCTFSQVIKKFKTVEIGMTTYGSRMACRSLRSARIRASWCGDDGTINSLSLNVRPGYVKYYIRHEFRVGGTSKEHIFAIVDWYQNHSQKGYFGNPIEVWKERDFEQGGPSTFLPVQRIVSTFAAASYKVAGIDSLVVSPIPYKIYV